MKAIVCRRYGDPDALRVEEIERPAPGDNEVLLEVRAAALNAYDWGLLRGTPRVLRLVLGLRAPRANRPGRDVAGRVIAVGAGVTRFRPGDDVFGLARGSLAEFVCTPESYLAPMPAEVAHADAAAVPLAGLTALRGLRDAARVRPGQRVLVNGAAGGVGTFAVQIARALGAEVTGVCGTASVETVRGIGAAHVIDYTQADFTRGAARYDVIFDLVGNRSFAACRRVLAPRGVVVAAGVGGADGGAFWRRVARMLAGVVRARFARERMMFFVARVSADDLAALGELLAARQVIPVIDSRHALCDSAAAMRRLATGHARGKILVTMDPPLGGAPDAARRPAR